MQLEETFTPRLCQKRYGGQAALSLLQEGRGRRLRRTSRSLNSDSMRTRYFFSLSSPPSEERAGVRSSV